MGNEVSLTILKSILPDFLSFSREAGSAPAYILLTISSLGTFKYHMTVFEQVYTLSPHMTIF